MCIWLSLALAAVELARLACQHIKPSRSNEAKYEWLGEYIRGQTGGRSNDFIQAE